jgi:tripartite-type tricarboxylate transporter receptor subunit TctC
MHQRIGRRALLGAPLAMPALAHEGFPSRPVTLICPWPPGGGADTQMRALALGASRHLGQRIVIENRPGAVGTLGLTALTQARADGYMLSQMTNAALRQPFITRTPWDPLADFTFVMGVTAFEFGIVVRAAEPWRSLSDLIDHARANPGRVTYGSFGIGSPPHVAMDRIGARHGLDWTHLPFRGTSENLTQLLGGHIQASADGTGWAPFLDRGEMRLLATMGERRLARWPEVPTLRDLGYDIVEFSPWGIVGPKGMDPAVTAALEAAFRSGMEEPEFRAALATLAQEPWLRTGAEYRAYAEARRPAERAVVERYNLRAG